MAHDRTRRILRIRSRLRAAHARWRNRDRALPDFLILGTQKGGTTSLFEYLEQHPRVLGPTRKEIHYFADRPNPNNYRILGPGWYRSHFPGQRTLRELGAITGEATPDYMVEPTTMRRIADDLPASRWIVLLRDPILRAASAHAMEFGRGRESLPFADAVAAELDPDRPARSGPDEAELDYLRRGHYADQLATIESLRPDRPTLVLFSEDVFARNRASFELLHRFLDLDEPGPEPERFPWSNASERGDDIATATRVRVESHFATVNAGIGARLERGPFLTVAPEHWPDWVDRGRRSGRTQSPPPAPRDDPGRSSATLAE